MPLGVDSGGFAFAGCGEVEPPVGWNDIMPASSLSRPKRDWRNPSIQGGKMLLATAQGLTLRRGWSLLK